MKKLKKTVSSGKNKTWGAGLLVSFKHALEGWLAVFRQERNFRLEVLFLFLVVLLSLWFQVSFLEFLALVIVSLFVLVMEILNTVLEYFLDFYSKRRNRKIKFLKDAMAGAVLISSLLALLTAVVIFYPYFFIF